MGETPEKSAYDSVREYWLKQTGMGGGDDKDEPTPAFEAAWRRWLHDGVMADTALAGPDGRRAGDALSSAATRRRPRDTAALEIAFRLDPCVLDGRFANNGWLQELPKPITKLTWDNAVLVSPATAERLEVDTLSGDARRRARTDRQRDRRAALQGPDGSGRGVPGGRASRRLRHRASRLRPPARRAPAAGAGFNAYAIRTADALWAGRGLEIVKTGTPYSLACTQAHHSMEGRGMVRAVTQRRVRRAIRTRCTKASRRRRKTLTLLTDYQYDGYKWGMAIDVNACIGCNACVVGCQAENNIPVVGKDQVLRGREMHWMRVDTYYRGEADDPETYFQPVPCSSARTRPARSCARSTRPSTATRG